MDKGSPSTWAASASSHPSERKIGVAARMVVPQTLRTFDANVDMGSFVTLHTVAKQKRCVMFFCDVDMKNVV